MTTWTAIALVLLTFVFGYLAFMHWRGKVVVIRVPFNPHRELTTAEQNERLYANIATCQAFGQCSIVEIMKNDLSTAKAFDLQEWIAMIIIYGVFILGQRWTAVKAFRSDPNVKNKNPDSDPPGVDPGANPPTKV